MERVNILLQQARLLRILADGSPESRDIKDRMRALAKDCEELAIERERMITSGALQPLGRA